MTYKLVVSERAEEQIDNIIGYVAVELSNPTAAKAIIDDIEKAYNKLEYMADSLALCQDPYLSQKGYRKYILDDHDYVILYRLENKEVHISGVFHMKEDYASKL